MARFGFFGTSSAAIPNGPGKCFRCDGSLCPAMAICKPVDPALPKPGKNQANSPARGTCSYRAPGKTVRSMSSVSAAPMLNDRSPGVLFEKESLRYSLMFLSPGWLWAALHFWRASSTVEHDILLRKGADNGRDASRAELGCASEIPVTDQ